MKNLIGFHGTGDTPEFMWFPWLKKEAEANGFTVSMPQLPDADNPDVNKWLPAALEQNYTEETVIVGHSAGAALILPLLESLNVTIAKAIIVAGYCEPVNPVTGILKDTYDWEKMKQHVKEIYIINSDDDPWKCDDKQGLKLFQHLGGTLILCHNMGHFGSQTYKRPLYEFPLLLKLID